ncbi:hypothetical protein HCUR_00408 [Holospora curviuscula]|uniref:Uncharacterized protein n=1 Tax=Holospora curviuscula TaxID=1082868 RepID=A0A2S5RA92_9PROT|nr:hypothetical protein HCUR_00408 [Holospora curviuscula]
MVRENFEQENNKEFEEEYHMILSSSEMFLYLKLVLEK